MKLHYKTVWLLPEPAGLIAGDMRPVPAAV